MWGRPAKMSQKWRTLFLASTLPNVDQFSQFFHCSKEDEICNGACMKF